MSRSQWVNQQSGSCPLLYPRLVVDRLLSLFTSNQSPMFTLNSRLGTPYFHHCSRNSRLWTMWTQVPSSPSPPSLSDRMRAWQSTSTPLPESLSLTLSAPIPQLPPSSSAKETTVLIRVHYSSLNHIDYLPYSIPLLNRLFFLGSPSSGVIPGKDFSGTVISLFPQPAYNPDDPNSSIKPGDKVFGTLPQFTHQGSLADYTLCPLSNLARVPPSVPMSSAAALGTTGLVALHCLSSPTLVSPLKKILINGATTAVGLFLLQLAHHRNIHVTATCSTANISLIKSLGADDVIDYTTVTPSLTETLKATGHIFDRIVDCVGVPFDLYSSSHHFLREGGLYLQIGAQMTHAGIANAISRAIWPGWAGGGRRAHAFVMGHNGGVKVGRESLEELAALVENGVIRVVVDGDRVRHMDEVQEGFERLRGGKARGKVVIKVAEED